MMPYIVYERCRRFNYALLSSLELSGVALLLGKNLLDEGIYIKDEKFVSNATKKEGFRNSFFGSSH